MMERQRVPSALTLEQRSTAVAGGSRHHVQQQQQQQLLQPPVAALPPPVATSTSPRKGSFDAAQLRAGGGGASTASYYSVVSPTGSDFGSISSGMVPSSAALGGPSSGGMSADSTSGRRPRQSSRAVGPGSRNRVSTFGSSGAGAAGSTATYYGTISTSGAWSVGGGSQHAYQQQQRVASGPATITPREDQRPTGTRLAAPLQPSALAGPSNQQQRNVSAPSSRAQLDSAASTSHSSGSIAGAAGMFDSPTSTTSKTSWQSGKTVQGARRAATGEPPVGPPPSSSRTSIASAAATSTSTPTKQIQRSQHDRPLPGSSSSTSTTGSGKFTSPPPPPPLTDMPLPPLPPLPAITPSSSSTSSLGKKRNDIPGQGSGQSSQQALEKRALGVAPPTTTSRTRPASPPPRTGPAAPPRETHSPHQALADALSYRAPSSAPRWAPAQQPAQQHGGPSRTAPNNNDGGLSDDAMVGLGFGEVVGQEAASASTSAQQRLITTQQPRTVSEPVRGSSASPQISVQRAPLDLAPADRASPRSETLSPDPATRRLSATARQTGASASGARRSSDYGPSTAGLGLSPQMSYRRSEDSSPRPSEGGSRLSPNLGLPVPGGERSASVAKKGSSMLGKWFGRGAKASKREEATASNNTQGPVIRPRKSLDLLPMIPRRRASEDMLRSRTKESSPALDSRPRMVTPEPPAVAAKPDLTLPAPPRQTAAPTRAPPSPAIDNSDFTDDDDDDDNGSEGTAVPRSISPLPPSLSLHFNELPQLDLSVSNAFDSLLKGLNGTSPKKSPRKSGSMRKSRHSHRRSRSFSSFNKPLREMSHSSSQSIASKAAKEEAAKTGTSDEEHAPSLTLSDHGRTFSGASSSMVDSPRTPGSGENQAVGIYNASSTSISDIPAVPALPPIAELEKKRDNRPRQLQVDTQAAAAAVIALAPAIEIKQAAPNKPREQLRKRRPLPLVVRSQRIHSQCTQSAIADQMHRLLAMFRLKKEARRLDKATLLRTDLLDCLVEAERRGFQLSERPGNAAVRAVSVEWVHALLVELQTDQQANERGACLEALSAIIESSVFSARALDGQPADKAIFRGLMVRIMTYVLNKLSGKGVFHNTLLFAGRTLAFAFFRIEGIAHQLLTALPTKPVVLTRFVRSCQEFTEDRKPSCESSFPAHLEGLSYDTAQAYTRRLNAAPCEYSDPEEDEAFHFRPGNWLRRWQSDDSELFPAFYKAYHRQLAAYLGPAVEVYEREGKPLPISHLLRCPGYAHLAAVFSTKCHSYIVGAVNAVTTTSASNNFDANESAGFKGNVKPPILETANRRLSEVILNLTTARMFLSNGAGQVIEVVGHQLWASIIESWIKALISRTSLYSPKGVFCLFDLLDSILSADYDQPASPGGLKASSVIDTSYLINVVRIILTETEHHLTLAKCVAFVWTHFETFCATPEDREALCIKLLLDPIIFQRLMLFWSQSVRSYVLRLIVFRLGHVGNLDNEDEITTAALLNRRLEHIRKRHNELEPAPADISNAVQAALRQSFGEGVSSRGGKSTITMVEGSPSKTEGQTTKSERILGFSSPVVGSDGESPELIQNGTMSKASKWFKKSFGSGKPKKGKSAGSESESEGERPSTAGKRDMAATSRPSLEAPASILQPPQADSFRPISPAAPKSPTPVQFEFELPMSSPRSDTFDNRPAPMSPRKSSTTASPGASASNATTTASRVPASPHMSRSFSKRSSLLPQQTASVLASPLTQSQRRSLILAPDVPAYDKRLHPYCIRMLAELEDVQKEYDDWYAEDGPGRLEGGPPRLQVAWPFADDED